MAAWPARDPASIPDETLLAFLVEDMGPELIDVTSDIAFGDDPDAEGPAGSAAFVAREPCVVSGIRLATRVFEVLANAQPTPGPATTSSSCAGSWPSNKAYLLRPSGQEICRLFVPPISS